MVGTGVFTSLALSARTASGIPRNAVLARAALVAALLLTGSFERVMAYTGFALGTSSLLAVLGLSLRTLGFVLTARPRESLLDLATVLAGIPVSALLRDRPPRTP